MSRVKNNKNTKGTPYKSEGQIAVVGLGCRYPGAKSPRELWQNILAGRVQFREMPDCRLPLEDYYNVDQNAPDKTYGTRAAVIDGYEFDWSGKRIPKSTFESTDIVHWLALDTTLQMLNDTEHGIKALPKERTAVIIGNTLTGEFTRSKTMRLRWPFVRKSLRATALECGMGEQELSILEQRMEERFKSVFPAMDEDSLAGGLANTIAGRICNYLDLNGGGYTVDGACSSSLIAIYTAASQLSNKTVDFAIAGGVDISLDPFELIGFAKTGALTKSEMRVYDKRGNGFIPGEGCGIVGLKRLEDAERDGDKIYAVLKGWGISSDGKGGITAPSDSGQSLAIRRALDVAKLDPKDLDFIEGHGTGTAVGDKVEILGIAKTLPNQNKRTCGITSFKSLVGHTKAAAGVGAFIKTVMAVNQRILPPTNGCELPHDEFSKNAQMIYPIQKGKILEENTLLNAGISAMGFGGINSHLIIASGSKVFPHLKSSLAESSLLASKQNTELFIFAGSDLLALKTQIEYYIPVVKLASYAELTDISALLAKKYQQLFDDKSHSTTLVRAAVVGSTPYEFLHRLKALAKIIDSQVSTDTNTIHHIDQDKGIWLASNVNDIRLGFLFPGQGSQQINMGRMLFDRYSWAKDIVNYANCCFKEAGEERVIDILFPASDQLVSDIEKNEAEKLLTNTEITQPALVLCSVLWLKYLEKLGIKPSSVMGHSLGELVAFYAAGSFDEKTLYTLAVMRGKQMAQPPGTSSLGAMVSLSCNKAEALNLISSLSRDTQKNLFLANINSEKQTVISGVSIAIDELVSAAETNKTRAVKLHVSNAFHSPMVNKAAEYLAEHSPLQQHSNTLSCSLISSTNGEKVEIDIDLVKHFSQQLITPVNFIAAVNRIKDETDILIEVGAGKVLSHLVENITQEKNYCHPICSSAIDDRDLNNLIATLFSVGININWDEFYNQRLVIDFKPASERQFLINPCEKELTATHFSIAPLFSSEMSETLRSVSNVIDIEPQFLQPYLKQRGDFITNVIKSDIKSLSLLPDLGGSPFKEVHKIESLHSISSAPIVIEEKPNLSGNVFNLFVVAIVDKTGFEEDSITSNLNMLNDLNLDSIKAGEIISNIALDLGVSEHIDPVDFVDVTVGEIADTLEGLLLDNDSDQRKQHLLNDNINHSPTPLSDSWVRSFSLNVEENPYQPQDKLDAINFSESLADQSVIIIRASEQETVANDLTPHLIELGAHVDVVLINELKEQVKIKSYHHYIIMCNEFSLGFDATSNQLQDIVSFFATVAVNRVEQAKPCLSMTYLQLSNTNHPNRNKGLLSRGAGSFAASIHLENPNIKIRVLDYFSVTSAEKIYQDWLLEMALIQPFNHVILNEKTRLALFPKPLDVQCQPTRNIEWSAEDVFLVTGGAKGITAECCLALSKETRVSMALIGSSGYPDKDEQSNEINKTLERFKELNIKCQYYTCDITNQSAVNTLVHDIEEELGSITGVIHGAGLNKPRRSETVNATEALAELSPKVLGALNLCQALSSHPPKLFVGFTSIIGVTGMPGNSWYAFANTALNNILNDFHLTHPETQTQSIAYSVWGDVGMGAKLGSVKSLAKKGIYPIPTQLGVEQFLSLVKHQPVSQQIVVTARLAGLDTWNQKVPEIPIANRFLQDIRTLHPGIEIVSRTQLTFESDLYLIDHNYRGSYLFPTVLGLEAMAQNVAYVLGKTQFTSLSIENIQLRRPIVVDEHSGTNIEIRAEVEERSVNNDPYKVNVSVMTEQSGYSRAHFSACFVINDIANEEYNETPYSLPGTDLGIEPKVDLYGGLLFQGPIFQRLESVYSLDSDSSISSARHELFPNRKEIFFSKNLSNHMILGDPAFRDTMLQAAQLSDKGIFLPIEIECISIHKLDEASQGKRYLECGIVSREGDELTVAIQAYNDSGYIKEELNGYRLKRLELDESNALPEEWANPSERDARIFQEQTIKNCQKLSVVVPKFSIAYHPKFASSSKDIRRQEELPLFSDAIKKVLLDRGDDLEKVDLLAKGIEISSTPSGKPQIVNEGFESISASLSHNENHCLCVAGDQVQGCDIERVTSRLEQNWLSLIGHQHSALLVELQTAGDTLDQAGTRVWTAVEAFVKAYSESPKKIEILQNVDNAFLLNLSSDKNSHFALSFSVTLTRPREKMVAILLAKEDVITKPKDSNELTLSQQILNIKENARSIQTDDVLEENIYSYVRTNEKGERQACYRFRATFKDARSLSRSVNYSVYSNWMGRVRELSIMEISDQLVPDFASGKWGMVTNSSNITIVGDVKCLDVIEGRTWISRVYGRHNSTVDMHYDWIKIAEDGTEERVAYSNMITTWVAIKEHGVVEVKPLPLYMDDFFKKRGTIEMPENNSQSSVREKLPESLNHLSLVSDILYQAASAPIIEPELSILRFYTTLEESNLVGNIYYAHYYEWQSRIIDRYFYSLAPEYYRGTGELGEICCINSEINHVREAMPLDTIKVRMALKTLFRTGFVLYFDFYSEEPSGKLNKLAYGTYQGVWTKKGQGLEQINVCELPIKIVEGLLKQTETTEKIMNSVLEE